MTIAFAIQHRIAGSDITDTFEFLSGTASTLQELAFAVNSPESREPLIQTASSVRLAALRGQRTH